MSSKNILILIITLCFLLLVGCTNNSPESIVDESQPEQQQEVNAVDQAREQVIEKFKNERDIVGTGKFIEDTYNQYPDDEVISTIYYYDSALTCYEFSDNGSDKEWFEEAKAYASKISPTYNGEFSDEIIPYVTNLLGDEWSKISQETAQKDKTYSNLTFADKVEIFNYIESQYDYYNEKEGRDTGDKYSDIIWEETANKYGVSQQHLMDIWTDTEIMRAANGSNSYTQETPTSYDATLDYDGQEALIAVSENAMDRFLTAISNDNQGTIDEMFQGGQVAQVSVGTHANIIEKKFGLTKVKILDGNYAGNEVWVLMESVHEK